MVKKFTYIFLTLACWWWWYDMRELYVWKIIIIMMSMRGWFLVTVGGEWEKEKNQIMNHIWGTSGWNSDEFFDGKILEF